MITSKLKNTWRKLVVVLICLAPATGEAVTTSQPAETMPASCSSTKPASAAAHLKIDRNMWAACRQLESPLQRSAAHLSAANWLLAVPPAEPATRWVLDMRSARDVQQIAEAGQLANQHLRQARKALKLARKKQTSRDEKRRRYELEIILDTLQPFADVWNSAFLKPQEKAYKDAFQQAAYDLAISREAEQAIMADAAMLWQAFCWKQIGQQEQALRILPEALAKPEFPEYGLLSRLIRCQLLAQRDQNAAALALAIRIGEVCKEWWSDLENTKQATQARATAIRVQIGIAQKWLKQLQQENSPQAKDIQEILNVLQERSQTLDTDEMFTLTQAIPIIIQHAAIDKAIAGEVPALKPATRTAPAKMSSQPAGRKAPSSSPASMPTSRPVPRTSTAPVPN